MLTEWAEEGQKGRGGGSSSVEKPLRREGGEEEKMVLFISALRFTRGTNYLHLHRSISPSSQCPPLPPLPPLPSCLSLLIHPVFLLLVSGFSCLGFLSQPLLLCLLVTQIFIFHLLLLAFRLFLLFFKCQSRDISDCF